MVRILYIEDTPFNMDVVRRMLKTMGHELIEAMDGAEGLRVAKEQSPDIILLDINMEGMSGYDVLAVLKAEPETQAIPVIALTADTDNRTKVMRAGCSGYVNKPFSKSSLLQVINQFVPQNGIPSA